MIVRVEIPNTLRSVTECVPHDLTLILPPHAKRIARAEADGPPGQNQVQYTLSATEDHDGKGSASEGKLTASPVGAGLLILATLPIEYYRFENRIFHKSALPVRFR
jgi:hypothetical protein